MTNTMNFTVIFDMNMPFTFNGVASGRVDADDIISIVANNDGTVTVTDSDNNVYIGVINRVRND